MNVVDWKKKFVLGAGGVALVAALVVLGATVMRIQNLQTTTNFPKAVGTYDNTKLFPACAPGGSEPSCCSNMAAGGVDACGWPERGWCSNDHCEAGKNGGGPNTCSSCADAEDADKCEPNQCPTHCRTDPGKTCSKNGGTFEPGAFMGCTQANRGCNCGLYVNNPDYCKQPPTCTTGKAVYPSPTVWQENVSTRTILRWMLNPFPSGGGGNPYANIYLWSCQAKTDDCMVFAGSEAPYYDSAVMGQFYRPSGKGGNFLAGEWETWGFLKSLKPNTQYWWLVTPGVAGCGVQIYADTWTFTTGAATATGTGSITASPNPCIVPAGQTGCDSTLTWSSSNASNVCIVKLADPLVTEDNLLGCGPSGTMDANFITFYWPDTLVLYANYDQGLTPQQNKASGNLKELSKVTVTGSLAATTHYGCVNKTCAVVSGAAANANGCASAGGICCASAADCAAGQTCDVTKTPNSCVNTATCNSTTCPSGCCSGTLCVAYSNQTASSCGTGGVACSACTAGQSCTSGVCTTTSEANSCWGNSGTDGKCYDCNGDGVINVLDFSCFRNSYGQTVQ